MRIVPFLTANQFVFGVSVIAEEDVLSIQIFFFGVEIYW